MSKLTLGLLAVLLVAFGALSSWLVVERQPVNHCALVDYVHGTWYNHQGEAVGLAPVEDAPITYLGECGQ